MFNRTLVFALAAALLLASGCTYMQERWKDTMAFYDEYIEPEAEVDIEAEPAGSPAERRLAGLIKPVDTRLADLDRLLSTQDTFPSDRWVNSVLQRYPWLDGVAAVDPDGGFYFHQRHNAMKPFDASGLFAMDRAVWESRTTRAVEQETPLGPEWYLAMPFFKDNEWRGLTVVYFDPRTLLQFSPDPDAVVVFTPGTLVWPGSHENSARTMLEDDWQERLEDATEGRVEVQEQDFYWTARYLGRMKLVYAVASPE